MPCSSSTSKYKHVRCVVAVHKRLDLASWQFYFPIPDKCQFFDNSYEPMI